MCAEYRGGLFGVDSIFKERLRIELFPKWKQLNLYLIQLFTDTTFFLWRNIKLEKTIF